MNSSRIDRLARLQELRAAGALSEEEFEAQKRVLLDGPGWRARWPLFAGLGIAVVGSAVGIGLWSSRPVAPLPEQTPRPTRVAPTPMAAPVRSPAERLSAAFEAATGRRAAFTGSGEGESETITPLRIVDLPFGPALLVSREQKDGCHACAGALDIYYLSEEGGQVRVAGRYRDAVPGSGWGAAPTDWQLTTRFTTLPAIYATGGYTGQGINLSSATITELTPAGPMRSDLIGTGFSNEGMLTDDSQAACEVTGTIADVVKDRSFAVAIAGSVSGRDRYVKRGGRFVAAEKIDWEVPCSG